MRHNMRWGVMLAALALAALACNAPGLAPDTQPAATPASGTIADGAIAGGGGADTLTREQIETISAAAVQIIAAEPTSNGFETLWTGSGTLISPDGQIVTNCHVACGAPVLVILMTDDPDVPPTPRYIAQVTHYDEELDLALLQIAHNEAGQAVSDLNLPYLPLGDSSRLSLGDRLFIFGYPGVGGQTITFTSGAVSGFQSEDVGGVAQRVVIKTDAAIASGNSGGTAVDREGRLVAIPTSVNPDVREGVTLGGLGILRPANLVSVVQQQAGSPPLRSGAALPPGDDPDPNEPNETLGSAIGPVPSGEPVQGYISWEDDADVFWLDVTTRAPLEVTLSVDEAGFAADYDLYLFDRSGEVVARSEGQSSNEALEYEPDSAGRYWVAVLPYSGSSVTVPYTLTVHYDQSVGGGVRVTGRAVQDGTGEALAGGEFGLLYPDVSCGDFFGGAALDLRLVVARATSDADGAFVVEDVPRGATYPAYFIYRGDYICENAWLDVPPDASDTDLGEIDMSFE